MHPKITIITVCYNSESTIRRTIESVISQCYDNLEYILIDGGSKDKTVEIIHSALDGGNTPHHLISEPDNGIYDAMNKGLKMATGDLICMLNSDDWLEPGALKTVAETRRDDELCVLYGMERRIKNGLEKEVGFHSHNFLDEANIPHQASYVTKKCYEEFGHYDTKYKSAADFDFMMRLRKSNKVQFMPIYSILVNFSEGGMSAGSIGYIEEAKIRRKYGTISASKYFYLLFRVWFLKMIGQLK